MSKDTPEVGDVWIKNSDNIQYHITNVNEHYIWYVCFGGLCVLTYRSSFKIFVEDCHYLGKSKANIDDLFKTENEE